MKQLLLVLLLFSSSIRAEEAIKQVYTDTKVVYGMQSISAISEDANVILNGTQVSQETVVNGNLTAEDATCNSLVVNGDAIIIDSTVTGPVSIYGNIQVIGSQINAAASTYAQTVLVINSTIGSLTIRNNGQPQTVTLQSGSRVNGTITFESGSGQVILSGNSYITGVVSGGKVQRM